MGICSRGAEDCDYEHVFHVWSGDCIGDVMPLGRDVCNGLDDDCDDETDEDDTFAGDLTGRWAVRSGRTGAGSGSVSAQCGQDGVRGAGKPERWFQFDVVGGPRNLVARVFGSRFDALLYLRPGTCDNVPQDAEDPLVPADDESLCVDNGGLGEPEELRVEDLPVGSYVLFVDGGSEQMDAFPHSGEFTLWLTLRDPAEPFPPALPDNDTCADITVAPAAPQYHEYFELRPGLTFHGDTRDATNASWLPDEPACTPDEPPGGETGRDRVYWFHREVGDPWWRLVLDVQMIDDVAFDASLYVRQGLCSNGALYRACDFTGGQDPNLRRRRYVSPPQVPVAGDYFVFVDAKGPVAGEEPGDEHLPGPFALRLEEPCGGEAAENRCSEEQECDAGRRSCYLPGHGVCAEPSQSSGRVYDTAAGGGVDRSHLYACLGCQRADDCWPDEECRQIVHVDSVEPGIVDVNNACVRPCASDGDCLRGRVCCQPFDAEECQAGGADGRCACANGMAGACIPERIRDWDD